jgi:hypothetical protein
MSRRILSSSCGAFVLLLWLSFPSWGDDKEPKYEAEKFRYPNAEKEGGGGILAPDLESQVMITKDDFKKVVKHYEKVVGDNLSADGRVSLIGTTKFIVNDSKDDGKDRPVKLLVYVHQAENYSLTLVISRANEEKMTHIALIYRSNK